MNDTEEQKFDLREPDVDDLKNDYRRVLGNLGWWVDQSEQNRDTRYNHWQGKGNDGRKHGEDAFPWDNASDLEPFLTNGIIDADVAMLKSSLRRSNLVASPVESSDVASSQLVTQFMRWLVFTRMEELDREAGIAANHLMEKGLTILGIYWKREVSRVYRQLTLEEILANAPDLMESADDVENFPIALENVLSVAYPDQRDSRISKMAKELLESGVTEYPAIVVTANRPALRTYELAKDIVFDSNVTDLQTARSIYCIHWYTPEEVRSKVLTEGWDEEWADDLIERGGGQYPDGSDSSRLGDLTHAYDSQSVTNYDGLLKVILSYRKETDEDNVPVCSRTIFSPHLEGYARHEVMGYDPVRYPFVVITREQLSSRLLDSRGLPELLRSAELAVKTEMDARRDRASLSTVPPLEFTVGRQPARIGPGAKIPGRRRGEVGFMEIPRQSPASVEVESSVRTQALKVAGRPTSQLDAVEAHQIRQGLVNDWLSGWKKVLNHVWALQRQYGDPEVWFRVTGNAAGAQLIMDRSAEVYDIDLSWDAQNADSEVMLAKMEKIGQIMAQYDRNGQGNFGEYMKAFIEALDPNLAARLVMPAQAASNKEIEETSMDIAKIWSGQVVNAPENANPQLRMQVLQNWLQGTEQIPNMEGQRRMQEDENFKARIETYAGQLQHQQAQAQNALIGKLGTAPGNVPAASAPMGAGGAQAPAQGQAPQAAAPGYG